jgi:hypothetical protein
LSAVEVKGGAGSRHAAFRRKRETERRYAAPISRVMRLKRRSPRGNAVNYAIAGQDASGLAFGDWRQIQPPRVDDDIARMLAKGIEVFAVTDDLADRGLADATLIKGVHRVPRSEVARLMTAYDRVWRW